MKLIIVDDNQYFRETLKDFVTNGLQHEVIAVAASGNDFLKIENIHEADVILMDLEMKNKDGVNATNEILIVQPWLKIIAVTMQIENLFLEQLIETGFKGCIFKTEVFADLQKALKEVKAGSFYFSKQIAIRNK